MAKEEKTEEPKKGPLVGWDKRKADYAKKLKVEQKAAAKAQQ